jgi:uncharacterized repeat protein (TIGR01451 family)
MILLTLVLSVGIVCAADGDANLSVSKVVSSAPPYETGQPVTWVVTISNEGPADATNISLSESISGFSGLTEMSGTPDVGSFNETTRIWNISKLDNATSAHLTIATVFDKNGTQTNNVDIIGLDQTSHGNHHAGAAVVLNKAVAVITDEPLSVNLTIRPNTLNLNSKGVFTVFVLLNGGTLTSKPSIDLESSSLACEGAEMISAGVSNRDGGTLIARFHRPDLEEVTNGTGVKITCSGTISVNGEMVNVDGYDTIRVIGEKKGLDGLFSRLLKYLGLEKDDSAISDAEYGNITVSVTLNPDAFKNIGQMKKAIRTTITPAPEETDTDQDIANATGSQGQDNAKNKGNNKNIGENNAGNNQGRGNKNSDTGDDASNGKSNGKKNK